MHRVRDLRQCLQRGPLRALAIDQHIWRRPRSHDSVFGEHGELVSRRVFAIRKNLPRRLLVGEVARAFEIVDTLVRVGLAGA